MRIGFLKIVAIIGLALVFNACGSRIDESVQDNIQESYSQNDEENAEVYQQQEGVPIDILIESKIDSAGILTLTEYEFSNEIALRAIERRIDFNLTNLDDRDAMIKTIENIFKKQGETYRIVKEKKVDKGKIINTTLEGASIGTSLGTIVPGVGNIIAGFGGALLGLGYSLKDVVIDKFAKKTNWLISKSPDEEILKIHFVKDQDN